jgi:hypothetical protein
MSKLKLIGGQMLLITIERELEEELQLIKLYVKRIWED